MSDGDGGGASGRLGAGRYLAPAEIPGATLTSLHELQTSDGASVSGVLRNLAGADTVAFLMHPRQDFTHHVLVPELLSRGYAVWTQGSRSPGNDLQLLHEQAILDMAAGHVFLRELGFERVISIGHSGGATLAAFYLEQAAREPSARLTSTPGGKPIPLADAAMPISDALVMMAPHPGQGVLLQRLIDPSVVDESNPLSVGGDWNAFDPANGFRPAPESSTYTAEFVDGYREAQRARVERIDAVARERIEATRQARKRASGSHDPFDERAALTSGVLTIYRTDADPRNVDLSLDRNDRRYGSLFGRRPDLTNYGVLGFGRLATPEAWLSTWSGLSSRANLAANLRSVTVPTLLVELTGDQACFPSDVEAFRSASAAPDFTVSRVRGGHFGTPLAPGEPAGATLAGEVISHWIGERFPAAAYVSA